MGKRKPVVCITGQCPTRVAAAAAAAGGSTIAAAAASLTTATYFNLLADKTPTWRRNLLKYKKFKIC